MLFLFLLCVESLLKACSILGHRIVALYSVVDSPGHCTALWRHHAEVTFNTSFCVEVAAKDEFTLKDYGSVKSGSSAVLPDSSG